MSVQLFSNHVEEELKKLSFNSSPAALYEPIRYFLGLGGKRLRPVLVLFGCDLFGGDVKKALKAAAGYEVFHNFTLLHDDIMDNAPLRRMKETVHSKWNINTAILSGDAMFVKAMELVAQTDDKVVRNVLELFCATALQVCEGQQADMDFESSSEVTIDDYLDMIEKKTAVLLAACLKTGAVIAGASQADASHLYEFGKNTGIAFQLRDDLLDLYGSNEKFGKVKGGDILSNKKTFLLLKAKELASPEQKEKLDKLYSRDATVQPEYKVKVVSAIFDALGIRQQTEKKMNDYYEAAQKHISMIDVPQSRKQSLIAFTGELMVREV